MGSGGGGRKAGRQNGRVRPQVTTAKRIVVKVGSSSLTTAELRVLHLLPTHLSFREIAERLYVSTNTVKTQAHAVYRKLDASSRSEAVDHARERGLLETEEIA